MIMIVKGLAKITSTEKIIMIGQRPATDPSDIVRPKETKKIVAKKSFNGLILAVIS